MPKRNRLRLTLAILLGVALLVGLYVFMQMPLYSVTGRVMLPGYDDGVIRPPPLPRPPKSN